VRAVALVALAVLVGCGGGGGDAAPRPTATPRAEVERGTQEPPNDALLVDQLVKRRTRARAVHRAAGLRMRVTSIDLVDLEVDGNRATARVALNYRIAGIRSTFQSVRRIDAVKRGGRWRIARIHGRRGLPPWETGKFVRRSSEHFVVLAPEGAAIDDLVASLESGYSTIGGVLEHGRLRRRYLVVVAGDAAQATALTTRIRGIETLAAISDASIDESGPERRITRVISLRLLVVLPAFAGLGPDGRGRIVTHELTHAALTGFTSGRTPAWLSEGIAMYVSGDRRAAPAGADLRALSAPTAIARATGDTQADAYATSSAAAFAIADRFGRAKLLALYDAFNDPQLAGEPGPGLAARAVRRELGVSLAELQRSL
jgi:hypothetical protein